MQRRCGDGCIGTAFVLDGEAELGGLASIQATVAVAIHFGDLHPTEVKYGGVGFHDQVADKHVVAVGHRDGEAVARVVGHVVGHGEGEGVLKGLRCVRGDAVVLGGAVGDGDVFRLGLQHGFEGVHRVAAHVLHGDVETDGLAEVELVVAVVVVDDLAVVNDVRSVGGNHAHHGFIAEVVLSGDDEVDLGGRHLGDELDVLRVASGSGHGQNLPTAFAVVFHQADCAAFRGCDIDFAQTSDNNFGMNDFHLLGHLRVDAQECVAVGGEHGVGDVLAFRVVGPVALGEEVFSGYVAKGRQPVAGVGGIGAEGGHEVAVEEVIDAPNVGIVDEGIGGLGGAEQAYCASVLTVEGAAHPGLGEAVLAIVELAREAVDGHHERQLAHVVHLIDVAVAHCGFAPAGLQAVVAVLQPESALVDGLHHEFGRAVVPIAQFGRRLGNVTRAVGSEVVDHHRGVLVARPNVAGCAVVDAVDAVGVVAVLTHVAAKHFGADLEPTLCLPTQCGDGTLIEAGVHVGVGVFIFQLLADEHGQLCGRFGNQARKHHVGQVVVALGIGIAVVGDAAAVGGVAGGFGGDVLAHVGAMVAHEADGHRGDVPSVVGVVEPFPHLVGVGGGHLIEAVHSGQDALACAVFLQLVGIFGPSVVVGRDDEVFCAVLVVAQPFLHTLLIVDDGQLVVVQKLCGQDGIPIGRAQAVFTEMAVAAFKLYRELDVGVDNQVFRDGVVLERGDGYRNGFNATDVAASHDERLGREEGILAVDVHVLHIVHVRLFVLRLDAKGRRDVDVVDGLFLEADHTQGGLCAIGDGHHAALGRQVGHSGIGGKSDGRDADLRHLLATIAELVEAHLAEVVRDVQPVASLLCQVEALLPFDGIAEGLRQSGVAHEGQQCDGKRDW